MLWGTFVIHRFFHDIQLHAKTVTFYILSPIQTAWTEVKQLQTVKKIPYPAEKKHRRNSNVKFHTHKCNWFLSQVPNPNNHLCINKCLPQYVYFVEYLRYTDLSVYFGLQSDWYTPNWHAPHVTGNCWRALQQQFPVSCRAYQSVASHSDRSSEQTDRSVYAYILLQVQIKMYL